MNEEDMKNYLNEVNNSIILMIAKNGKITMLKREDNVPSEEQLKSLENLSLLTTDISIVLKLVLFIEVLFNRLSIFISNKFSKTYKS